MDFVLKDPKINLLEEVLNLLEEVVNLMEELVNLMEEVVNLLEKVVNLLEEVVILLLEEVVNLLEGVVRRTIVMIVMNFNIVILIVKMRHRTAMRCCKGLSALNMETNVNR